MKGMLSIYNIVAAILSVLFKDPIDSLIEKWPVAIVVIEC